MSNVFNFGLSSSFKLGPQTQATSCRRQGERVPLPVEVEIEIADRTIRGIVRDVTIDKNQGSQAVGISLMHYEPLSVDRRYTCRPVEKLKQLPAQFVFCVRWCRYFEDEAFISGGIVEQR